MSAQFVRFRPTSADLDRLWTILSEFVTFRPTLADADQFWTILSAFVTLRSTLADVDQHVRPNLAGFDQLEAVFDGLCPFIACPRNRCQVWGAGTGGGLEMVEGRSGKLAGSPRGGGAQESGRIRPHRAGIRTIIRAGSADLLVPGGCGSRDPHRSEQLSGRPPPSIGPIHLGCSVTLSKYRFAIEFPVYVATG